jgi:phosphoribosylformylglycinamidine synthase
MAFAQQPCQSLLKSAYSSHEPPTPVPKSKPPTGRYVDTAGSATERYPFNPNGSPHGIAALCSANGRHLAMMPHPERCFLAWQLPHSPPEVGLDPYGAGPWLRLFQNAREWAEANPRPADA